MRRMTLAAAALLVGLSLSAVPADAAKRNPRENMSARCKKQCRSVKPAKDGLGRGFRYKHSDLGGGMVALTYEYNNIARFIEANNCRVVETTRYWGVANGGRHHYYSARGKSGAASPSEMLRKAKKVGKTKRGYFQVGKLCYGPYNLGKEQD